MLRTVIFSVLFCALAFAGSLQAGLLPVGTQAPDFELNVGNTFNNPEKRTKLSEFRGNYVLLEFFFCGCPPCRAKMPTLVDWHTKYGHRGFSILACSISPGDVRQLPGMIKEKGLNYFIGVDGEIYKEYGATGFPTAFVLNPDGEIILTTFPSESQIEGWVDELDLPLPKVDRTLLKAVQKAGEAYDEGDFTTAMEEANEVAADERSTDEEKTDAEYVLELVAHQKRFVERKMEEFTEERDYLALTNYIESIEDAWKKSEFGDSLEEKLKEMKKDKQIKEEIKAREDYNEAEKALKEAGDDERARKSALKDMEKVADKYEGTKAAELAKAHLPEDDE